MDRINSPGVQTSALLWQLTYADSLTQPTQRVQVLVVGAGSMAQACGMAERGPTVLAFKDTFPNAVPVQCGIGGIVENP